MVSSLGNSVAQKLGFTGKEHQDELGLNWIDISARNYDASLGRWFNIDVLSQKYESYSPYAYVGNSPLKFSDLDGMDWYRVGLQYHYDPELTKENSEERLTGSQDYVESGKIITAGPGWKGAGVPDAYRLNSNGTVTFFPEGGGEKIVDSGSTLEAMGSTIHVYDDRPDPLDTKNGEKTTSIDGNDYILHDNQWLKLESKESYEIRKKNGKYSRRPVMDRETISKMRYDQKLVHIGGAKAATGVFGGSLVGKILGKFKYTGIGVIGSYVGGQINAYDSMVKRMKEHDKTVDHHRNKKKDDE